MSFAACVWKFANARLAQAGLTAMAALAISASAIYGGGCECPSCEECPGDDEEDWIEVPND